MENITLGQVATVLAFIVGLISSIKYLKNELTNSISKQLQPITKKIDNLELSTIRTSLVDFLSDIENGQVKDPIRIKNAYELYDKYKDLGGNSYVHDKWEKLKREGKI